MCASRTGYAAKNISTNFILYFVTYIAVFIARTFFVKILGNDYLSIFGLFQNVITIISFAELGLGSASVFSLYRPIAAGDNAKVYGLLLYFRKLYNKIIVVSLCVGVILMPGLPHIIEFSSLAIEPYHIYYFYLLFVINTAVSYGMIEYKLYLIADQKQYKVNIVTQSIHISILLLQTLYIFFTDDFSGYLWIQIIGTLGTNIYIRQYVRKSYPNIFNLQAANIVKDERKSIIQNIKSIFFYKIGAVILNGSDNIIISACIKTTLVGICSNYLLVINAINSVLMQCFNGIGASIGNHIIQCNEQEQVGVFKQLNLLCTFLYSFSSICLISLINPLIKIWLGDEYALGIWPIVSMVTLFYITGINQVLSLYRTSFGLFKRARFYPIIAAIANILLAVPAAKIFGLSAVFFATAVVKFVFFTVVDMSIVFKYGFKIKATEFVWRYFFEFAIVIFGSFVFYEVICSLIISSWIILISVAILTCLFSILVILLVYSQFKEFQLIKQRIISFAKLNFSKK